MADNNSYSVCWLGNAGWLLRIGKYKLLIDPDLEENPQRKSLSGIPEDCLKNADVILITHEHGDHFNRLTAKRLLNGASGSFVLPESCMEAAGEAGILPNRIIPACHGKPISLFDGNIRITPVPAVHGGFHGAVYKHYHAADCGYLVAAMGLNLFHPGDSVLHEAHFELPPVDILMVSPTEHNTNVRQSLTLIHKLNPRFIFPQHRDTYHETVENYFWTHAYDKELAAALDEKFSSRYHRLEQGQKFFILPIQP